MSLPLWERGLKSEKNARKIKDEVAPLVGAWIEMTNLYCRNMLTRVAPLVGAWIEIV